eukprot:1141520-Pelagomonas_calceolata.AAC.2
MLSAYSSDASLCGRIEAGILYKGRASSLVCTFIGLAGATNDSPRLRISLPLDQRHTSKASVPGTLEAEQTLYGA